MFVSSRITYIHSGSHVQWPQTTNHFWLLYLYYCDVCIIVLFVLMFSLYYCDDCIIINYYQYYQLYSLHHLSGSHKPHAFFNFF